MDLRSSSPLPGLIPESLLIILKSWHLVHILQQLQPQTLITTSNTSCKLNTNTKSNANSASLMLLDHGEKCRECRRPLYWASTTRPICNQEPLFNEQYLKSQYSNDTLDTLEFEEHKTLRPQDLKTLGPEDINSFTAKSVLETVWGQVEAQLVLIPARRTMVISSKTAKSPTRGRDDYNSSLRPPSILSTPYPQVLVQSYEFAWAVFFNNKFKSKMLTRRNYALLMFKIDGDNHYQANQTSSAQLLSTCIVRPLVPQAHSCCRNRTRSKNCHSAIFPRFT